MRYYFCCIVLFLATIVFSCKPNYQQCRSEFLGNLPTNSMHAHVMIPISIIDENGISFRVGIGSGIVIAQSKNRIYVLTVKHAVLAEGIDIPSGSRVKISILTEKIIRNFPESLKSANEAIEPVKVEKIDPLADLALISYESPLDTKIPRIFLSKVDPEVGESVWLIGSPSGHFRSLLARVVSAKVGRDVPRLECEGEDCSLGCPEGIECFLVDGPVEPGFSGGPTFDSKGCLVGIIYAVRMSPANGQFMNGVVISASSIRNFLKGIIQENDRERL